MAGVILAHEWALFISVAWLLTGLAMCLCATLGGRVWLLPVALLGGAIVGLWRGSGEQVHTGVYAGYVGSAVELQGVVSEDIDYDQQGRLVLRLHDIMVGQNPMTGSVWATSRDDIAMKRSDIVLIRGDLSEGFGSFAASVHTAEIISVRRPEPGDMALKVRDYFAEGVNRALNDTEASLGLGYLVGQRRGLPEDLDAALTAAGLTHIVVASGYNLTILVRLARRLFERISKYLSLLVSGGMIAGFIAITGASPSMTRAGLVAGLSLVAWYYGRRFHPLVLLPFVMAITVLIQPSYAWGDLGWQLSFAAFGGVMVLAPLLQAYLFGDKTEHMLRRIFIETIAATVMTLPILINAFGQFSVIAPVANMAILPLVPLAMALTFVAGAAGLLVPAVAAVLGWPAQLVLTYMTTSAGYFGSLPWAVQEASLPSAWMFVAYACIVACMVYMRKASGYQLHRSSVVE